jgi:hypothetical protein
MLLNSTSAAEASLALEVLTASVPEKALITACNLREIIRSVPRSPFRMCVDEDTLVLAAGLTRDIAVLGKVLPDDVEVCVTTAGNLVLDLIVRADGEKYYWTPIPAASDAVNPPIVELAMRSPYLVDAVVDLLKSMCVVFNPKFYMSLDDFRFEHATAAFGDLDDLF